MDVLDFVELQNDLLYVIKERKFRDDTASIMVLYCAHAGVSRPFPEISVDFFMPSQYKK